MKISSYFILILIVLSTKLSANEGMWLPIFLAQLNEAEMKQMGMKISASDIYDINKGSLKDAIVSLGGFCTAEVISNKGLILTNHHCGYDAIQDHTTLEKNYLKDGFWAYKQEQELENKGLTATFIKRMEDVTAIILNNVAADMSESDRQSTIDKNIAKLRKDAVKEAWQELVIRPFFDGNQYFMFVVETFRDVRLVGAPPSSIGKFGSDTDNWVWPRHTGDFSMFRIYADKNNRPAEYSTNNVPYTPLQSLKISLDGMEEGDFTMVMGFPGRTQEYLPSGAVAQTQDIIDPTRITMRDHALKVMDGYMRKNESIKIQYAPKYASVANGWKKWIGEVQGLKAKKAVEKKINYETEFNSLLNTDPLIKKKYGGQLEQLNLLYKQLEPYVKIRESYRELFSSVMSLNACSNWRSILTSYDKLGEKAIADKKQNLLDYTNNNFKENNIEVDKALLKDLIALYVQMVGIENIGKENALLITKYKNDYSKLVDDLLKKSIFYDQNKILKLIDGKPADLAKNIGKDKLYLFTNDIMTHYYNAIEPNLNKIQPEITRYQRKYMQAQMDAFATKKFYPDANSTLRVTYGKVASYEPRDGVKYNTQTYLEGMLEKYIPGDYEFDMPAKLIDLCKKKDYGQYGTNGKMPLALIGSNHTTGGNSGSPALDAYGNLIGLNFDRVWEGTMSDINYDASICRNIMVDVRFVLFIIDKYAGATNLISELNLVHPKGK
jgi:Peptidase S46